MEVSRADLQALAETRLQDAQTLLAQQRFSVAYYLAGCAVELAMKALIARTLEDVGWNQSEAAKQLGISRTTLRKEIRAFGLQAPG